MIFEFCLRVRNPTDPSDPVAGGTLTFAAGETSETIEIEIINDSLGESTEYFLVNLDNATNSALGNPRQMRVEIIDDDQPTVSLANASFSVSEVFARKWR